LERVKNKLSGDPVLIKKTPDELLDEILKAPKFYMARNNSKNS